MYNKNRMSARIKTTYMRGKFFIETGSSKSFNNFLNNYADDISKYIPVPVSKRIEDLINSGDREIAVILWEKACVMANNEPSRRFKVLLFYVSYILIAIFAVIALFRTF